jgi:hypothetical protein
LHSSGTRVAATAAIFIFVSQRKEGVAGTRGSPPRQLEKKKQENKFLFQQTTNFLEDSQMAS